MAGILQTTLFKRVSLREKALFTRSLSAMISSGLPLIRGLALLADQTKNRYFKETLADVIRRLEQGEPLSTALSRYPKIFDKVYIYSIRAAEASGKFEQVLNELSETQEREYKFSTSVKAAIAYPIFVTVTLLITGALLIMIVIPKLETVFLESKIDLPVATRMMIWVADFLTKSWYIIIIALIAIIMWCRYYFKTDSGRLVWGEFLLRVPVFNELFTAIYMTRFTRTLSMLVASGVPIIEAVKILAGVMNNAVYENALKNVASELERGVPMSQPLSVNRFFPPIVTQMVLVGEQTGKLDEVLLSLATFFDDEVNKKVGLVTSLLEPILLIVVGIGVGLIVFAIIIPIYQISSNIQ